MLSKTSMALLPLLFTSITAHAAGWTATQESRSVNGSSDPAKTAQTSSLFFEKGLFRIDQDPTSSVIIDLQAGRFTFLNHAKKEHASVTVEELIQMRDKAMSEMKAQMPKLPPEVRKQIERQLAEVEGASKPNPEATPKKTGKTEKINGYDCAVYAWMVPDGDNEACIASKVGVDITEFTKATEKMSDRLSKAMNGKGSPGAFAMLELGKLGFPIRTRRIVKMGTSSIEAISELRDIKSATIDPSKFQVPEGYAKADLQTLMGGGRPSTPPTPPTAK